MKNMFKKTLIAVVLGGLSLNAAAATLLSPANKVASEVLNLVEVAESGFITGIHSPAVEAEFTFQMGVNYAVNDIITFEFDSVALDTTAFPATKTNAADSGFSVGDVVLSRINIVQADGKTTAVYRVSSIATDAPSTVPGTGETINAEFTFTEIDVKPRLVTGDITVSFAARTVGDIAIDSSGTNSVKVLTTGTYYTGIETEAFDAVVDVTKDRKQFVGDEPSSDYNVVVGADFDVAPNFDEVKWTVTGDFSWLLDADGEVDTTVGSIGLGNFCTDLVVDAAKLTYRCFQPSTLGDLSVSIDSENDVIIPTGSFSVSAVVAYDVGDESSTKTFTEAAFGTWTLNGSTVRIPYMPFGDNITQVINLNNKGTQTGNISVEAIDRVTMQKYGPVVVGTALPGKQVALAGAIKEALIAAGMPASERASITIITNVPAADVSVYSAYNVNGTGARLVVNDSNGKAQDPT